MIRDETKRKKIAKPVFQNEPLQGLFFWWNFLL